MSLTIVQASRTKKRRKLGDRVKRAVPAKSGHSTTWLRSESFGTWEATKSVDAQPGTTDNDTSSRWRSVLRSQTENCGERSLLARM